MACAGRALPPSGCGTLPGPPARLTEEHGTHLDSCVLTDSAADSTVPLGVAAGDTWEPPDPMCGTVALLLALWLKGPEIGAD